MNATASKIGVWTICLALCFLYAGCCDDWVRLIVLVGHRSPADCESSVQLRDAAEDGVRFLCPGEEVTICWDSNVSQVNISGFGARGRSGIEYMTVNNDTTVTATPIGSCASSKSVDIEVVSGPTPSTWVGKWNAGCSLIEFQIHEEFLSSNIHALDITPMWEPKIDVNGTEVTCATPPFLDGFQTEEVYGFRLNEPFLTESFSRDLKAVGRWQFSWLARCPVTWDCNPYASFPFDLTLECH